MIQSSLSKNISQTSTANLYQQKTTTDNQLMQAKLQ